MCTTLGGAVQACAAARAGMTRPTALPDFQVFDEVEVEPGPLTVHALPGLEGFQGDARKALLAAGALDDLLRNDEVDFARQRTGLVFCSAPSTVLRQALASTDPEEQ